MSVEKSIMQNLQKNQVTIKSKSTESVSFNGANPNYYKITNGGQDNVYLGVSMTPTKKFYDMCIPSGSSKLFVDAYGHDHVYIFNPSMEDAPLIITSFSAPFEPSVLALSEIGTDFSDIVINSNTLITGFEAPLPHGDNVIGKVKHDDETAALFRYLSSNISTLTRLFNTQNLGAYVTLADDVIKYFRHTVENAPDIGIIDIVSDMKLLLEGIKQNQEGSGGGSSSGGLTSDQADTLMAIMEGVISTLQSTEGSVSQLLTNVNTSKVDMKEYGLLYEAIYAIENHLSKMANSTNSSQVFELVRGDSTEKTINAPDGCYVASISDSKGSVSAVVIYKADNTSVTYSTQEGTLEDINVALKAYKPQKIVVAYRGNGTTVYTCESL